MLNKIVFLLLALFSQLIWGHNTSLPAMRVYVGNSEVLCEGFPESRFWLCGNESFEGFVDRYSAAKDKPYLPFIFDQAHSRLEFDLKLQVSEGQEFVFSDADYLELNLIGILDALEEGLMRSPRATKRCFKIIELFGEFVPLLESYKETLNGIAVEQKIILNNGVFSSRFVKIPDSVNKEPQAEISHSMAQVLNADEQIFYDDLVNSQGNEPILTEALELFNLIRARVDLPFHHTEDGCHARAHVIASELHAKGYRTGKIWLSGALKNPHQPDKEWWYHVAAIIYVNNGDASEIRVIDPSPTNNRLLSVEEWLEENHVVGQVKNVAYPLPFHAKYYGFFVLSTSSYRGFLPFLCDTKKSQESLLLLAKQRNELYCRKPSLPGFAGLKPREFFAE